ncbi:hypothetical protein BV25DRAFT_1937758 [Artomyces pyxidatus]|uniref:Uncharacterized protein n=1 Tax=Artomyces pyxidatus TaxID=48021 RepID=A0ACB8SG03_9AGAM|nr:hypothetical protein BV25DRAFT_1937758 [Artomyces pyxidatus]
MGRKKNPNPGKPGRKSWAPGTKFDFLERRVPQYRLAVDAGTVTEFYTGSSKLWTVKYGWDLPLEEDALEDTEDPDESALDALGEAEEQLTQAEVERRKEIFTELRAKIANWYRYQCRKVVKAEQLDASLTKSLENGIKKVKKEIPWQLYSKLHYATRVKPEYEAEWAVVSARPVPDGSKKPHAFNVRVKVTKRLYLEESDEFRADIERQVETRYLKALKDQETELAKQGTHGPESYQRNINNAYALLQPIVDNIFANFGMATTLMLAGPIPQRGGRIEAMYFHAGQTRGIVQQDWTAFDTFGFEEAAKSLTRFAQAVYPEDVCRSRALNSTAGDSLEAPIYYSPSSMPASSQAQATSTNSSPPSAQATATSSSSSGSATASSSVSFGQGGSVVASASATACDTSTGGPTSVSTQVSLPGGGNQAPPSPQSPPAFNEDVIDPVLRQPATLGSSLDSSAPSTANSHGVSNTPAPTGGAPNAPALNALTLGGGTLSTPMLGGGSLNAPAPALGSGMLSGSALNVPALGGGTLNVPALGGGSLNFPALGGGSLNLPALGGGSFNFPVLGGGTLNNPPVNNGARIDHGSSQSAGSENTPPARAPAAPQFVFPPFNTPSSISQPANLDANGPTLASLGAALKTVGMTVPVDIDSDKWPPWLTEAVTHFQSLKLGRLLSSNSSKCPATPGDATGHGACYGVTCAVLTPKAELRFDPPTQTQTNCVGGPAPTFAMIIPVAVSTVSNVVAASISVDTTVAAAAIDLPLLHAAASTSETSTTALEDPAESTVTATTPATSESGANIKAVVAPVPSHQRQMKMRPTKLTKREVKRPKFREPQLRARLGCRSYQDRSLSTVREPMPSQSTQPVLAPSSQSESSTASVVPPQESGTSTNGKKASKITTRGAAKAAIVKASSKHKPGVISTSGGMQSAGTTAQGTEEQIDGDAYVHTRLGRWRGVVHGGLVLQSRDILIPTIIFYLHIFVGIRTQSLAYSHA